MIHMALGPKLIVLIGRGASLARAQLAIVRRRLGARRGRIVIRCTLRPTGQRPGGRSPLPSERAIGSLPPASRLVISLIGAGDGRVSVQVRVFFSLHLPLVGCALANDAAATFKAQRAQIVESEESTRCRLRAEGLAAALGAASAETRLAASLVRRRRIGLARRRWRRERRANITSAKSLVEQSPQASCRRRGRRHHTV